jgi:hypothetical protein
MSAPTLSTFESTLPHGQAELMRVSSYERYLVDLEEEPWMELGVVLGTRLSGLSPSLLADLQRYEDKRYARVGSLDLLGVMAACVRHASTVTIHCSWHDRTVPLTVFPQQHWVHCPLSLDELGADGLAVLRVLHVEPALLQPPCDDSGIRLGTAQAHAHAALAPWLWAVAWHGAQTQLLPEIAGRAVYRISPSCEWERLPMDGSLRAAVQQLRLDSVNLRELAEWPGLSRERAIRLLNAIYLQAGLIVSRSHREAFSDSWWGGLGR